MWSNNYAQTNNIVGSYHPHHIDIRQIYLTKFSINFFLLHFYVTNHLNQMLTLFSRYIPTSMWKENNFKNIGKCLIAERKSIEKYVTRF